jgi:hypothetical protein
VKILVDTSIWSLAFRRKKVDLSPNEAVLLEELKELLNELRTMIIGPIRQEILSGIPDPRQFRLLKEKLSIFKDEVITLEDYELAAEFFNLCRNKGIQGSHIDFIICAVSAKYKYPLFTLDKDFDSFKKHCKIALHKPRF